MGEFFRNTLSPAQWSLLAAVPPAIVALYFLKLRRQPLEVPSTYLWLKSIEDLRVNSLWQRLRQSLLLFLQLLLVVLAILALLRPGWLGTDLKGQRLIFLVDNSASMSTRDASAEDNGPAEESRLDVAKQKVAGLIDQMDRGMTAMIVSFAGEPRVVQEFTDNTRLLRERLTSIAPTNGTTDLAGALELADGLANPAQVSVQEGAPEVDVTPAQAATLFIFSDGRFSDVQDFALGNLEPIYVPLGQPTTANIAITALETRKSEGALGERVAFVQAANYSDKPAEVVIELLLNDRLVDANRLDIAEGEVSGFTAPLGEASAGELVARISQSSLDTIEDRLPLDDTAYAAINESRSGRVLLITPGNVAIEQALATPRAERLGGVETESQAFLQASEYQNRASAGGYDLVIYDRCAPEEMPRSNTLFIGSQPPLETWAAQEKESETITVPQIIDWNRSHPLLAHIELGNFDIVDSLRLSPPTGSSTLIDAAEGPIAAIAPRNGYEDAVIGFPILVEVDGAIQRNTDWINRHSFPTFWLNTLQYFVASQSTTKSLQPGQPIELKPIAAGSTDLAVTDPSGKTATLRRRGQQPFVFQATDTTGVYRVSEAGQETTRFAVNLFDREESEVRLRYATADDEQAVQVASIRIGNIEVAATGSTPARQEIWRWLLLAALVVLLLEWYIYHRRVYV